MTCDECLKHSYYTRVGFSFSRLFYSNFIVFCGKTLELVFGVDAGTLEQKGSCWKQFWSIWRLCMKRSGALRRSNVTTSPRRDVPTSRRWVNQYNSQQAVTSRRRDVSTSRRQCEICPPSLKALRVQNSRDGEAYERGHGIPEQQRHRLRRSTLDLYCFRFSDTRMIFLRLNIHIFSYSMF